MIYFIIFDTNNRFKVYKQNIIFYIDTLLIYFIILNKYTGKIYFLLIYFIIFYIDTFIDLFIDLRYYFDTNTGDLKVYKQILFFTMILFIDLFIDFIDLFIDFIDLFIDFRYYFDMNNGG